MLMMDGIAVVACFGGLSKLPREPQERRELMIMIVMVVDDDDR